MLAADPPPEAAALSKRFDEIESRRMVLERGGSRATVNAGLRDEYLSLANEASAIATEPKMRSVLWLAGRAFARAAKTAGLGFSDESRAELKRQAITRFQAFASALPDDKNAPRALLEVSDLQVDLGNYAAAQKTLTTLLLDYDAPDVTEKVQERLLALEEKGKSSQVAASPKKSGAPLRPAPVIVPETQEIREGVRRVVLDPGHGGKDHGAVGLAGLREKEVVLDVARRLREILRAKGGYEVLLTRDDDRFLPLNERTQIANRFGADLLVSLHSNASPNGRVSGIETYYLDVTENPSSQAIAARENSSVAFEAPGMGEMHEDVRAMLGDLHLHGKVEGSIDLAGAVHAALIAQGRTVYAGLPDLGVRKAPFVVLIGATMPSILVELLFVDNATDSKLLRDAAFHTQLADGLARGISAYFER